MIFGPGDRVHVAALGKAIVREARNAGRYLVEIKGRSMVVAGAELTPAEPARPPRRAKSAAADTGASQVVEPNRAPPSLDLHGTSVEEALEAIGAFLNATLVAGDAEARIIHGRSGGRLKAAVHVRLNELPSIRSYSLDPKNPGVTIVKF